MMNPIYREIEPLRERIQLICKRTVLNLFCIHTKRRTMLLKSYIALCLLLPGLLVKSFLAADAKSPGPRVFYEDSLQKILTGPDVKWLLLNSEWLLTSGQNDLTIFAGETLSFINGKKYAFLDSIQLNPALRLYEYDEYYGYREAYFSFSFNRVFGLTDNKPTAINCLYPQYGFWSLDSVKSEITLTFLDSKNKHDDDLNTWPVKQKSQYAIISISDEKLVLQKK